MNAVAHSWGPTTFVVHNHDQDLQEITISGRELWMVAMLQRAGEAGCTERDYPGTRLAAHVHKLRKRGVIIKTRKEPNRGEFPGTHAVYCLVSDLCQLDGWEGSNE